MARLSPALVRLANMAAAYVGSRATVSLSDPDYRLLVGAAGRDAKSAEITAHGRSVYVSAADLCDLVAEAEKPAAKKSTGKASGTQGQKPAAKKSTGKASGTPAKKPAAKKSTGKASGTPAKKPAA